MRPEIKTATMAKISATEILAWENDLDSQLHYTAMARFDGRDASDDMPPSEYAYSRFRARRGVAEMRAKMKAKDDARQAAREARRTGWDD